jgi:hypothetical protein
MRILIVLAVFVILVFAGLVFLAQTVEVPSRPVEKVLPNDRFER